MRRRFLALTIGMSLVLWGVAVFAQQSTAAKRIGVVAISVSENTREAEAFRQGLRDAGYIEGTDIVIDWWYGEGNYKRVSEAVTSMLQRSTDVIVVEGTPAALAAKRTTKTVPIVMAVVGDPVGSGLVPSLARPGANVTGLTNQTVDLAAKRLQLLMEAVPEAKRVAIIYNPNTPFANKVVRRLNEVAPEIGVKLTFLAVHSDEELRSTMSGLGESNVDALMVLADAFMTPRGDTILELASEADLPVAYGYTPLARRGILISYAVEHNDLFRRAAAYVDKILKGAKPAELPIEQPTKFELVVNLKTADALGITIPQSILLRADEVIR
jgi:putative ABC transport system substrate-binding protein